MANDQTIPVISNGAASTGSPSENHVDECLSDEALLNELHEKYVRNRHGEAAKKAAEAAWTQESPALQRLLPKFKDELAPRYRVVKPLGVGGVGVVLQLFDTNLETPRALKFARPRSGREPFFAEIITGEISRLREAVHPNIIGIFQHGQVSSDGVSSPYYVMEFIPGAKDAAEYFTEKPHSSDDLFAVLSQALSGIAHLHEIGVLHGDIKLENILVAETGRAVISDLGSARRLKDGTQDTFLIFTRQYAHPSAIALATAASDSDSNRVRASLSRKSLQTAFDLYALGKNLLRLLTMYESPKVPPLKPYIRQYLKLMACRLLDGRNTDQECALALPRLTFAEIKYTSILEAETDLRKLTGQYSLSSVVPELDNHPDLTIQTSSLSPTPFTKRLERLISHPAMRRLARVPQLGFISLVYPTATHSRLEHVLGTLSNVVRYCDSLYNDALNPLFRQLMLIRLFQHTTICWGLGLRRVMSRTLGDDRRRTASIFVPAARNRDRARIGGTCSPRTSGKRPGTLGRPLRRRTESETGEESWERTDETLPTLHLVVS